MGAADLIDRNRRLLELAEASRALTQQVIDQVSETYLVLHVAALR